MSVNNLTTSEDGLNLIKQFESFRSKPYRDSVGVPTIGYGTTYLPDGSRVTMQTPAIDIDTATEYLQYAVQKFEKTINQSVTVELNQNQFDALVDFVYNVGAGNFISSTLLKVLNLGHYDDVAQQFMRWNKAGGKVLPGLTRRRQAECDLFNS